ncbi:MAG: hypothetical protein DRP65_11935 [Planctomycetota bacterium]|mgnify:CR=1 FL=1|nr:MAG: hypothetical protein DRP65_11935 [Planctomycetota bacterium]
MDRAGLQARLIQCRRDIAAIEEQEQELLKSLKREKPVRFARFVKEYFNSPRLILRLTPEFVQLVNKNEGRVVSFGPGYFGRHFKHLQKWYKVEPVVCSSRPLDEDDFESTVYRNIEVVPIF